MTEEQKISIIQSGKQYFRDIIIPKHLRIPDMKKQMRLHGV